MASQTTGVHSALAQNELGSPDTKHGSEEEFKENSEGTVSVEETTVNQKRLLAKIDSRLLPSLCVLYLAAFLDRVNISNALLFDLEPDLGITSHQFNNCLVIFFIPYVVAELPANMLMKRWKPHVWLSLCMFCFGVVTTLQGLTTGYSTLLVTRFFLGLFEAGMLPGSLYLLSMWYRRDEAQKRVTFFFNVTSLAGAFGGLLASAIGNMDGIRGLKAWRWVFILEGLLTCVLAAAWFFVIPDFPEDATFLTEEERAAVKARLIEDAGPAAPDEPYTLKGTLDCLKDYRVYLGGVTYFGIIVPAYGYVYFSPTIIKGLGGFTAIEAQLRSVPPYAVLFFVALAVATISDKARHRWAFTIIMLSMSVVGFIMLLTIHDHPHAQYAALFIVSSGLYATLPIVLCWFNGNLAGHRRRSIGAAWQVGFGNIGGIIAAYCFPASDAPRYTAGYAIGLAFVCVSLISGTAYAVGIWRENKKRGKEQVQGLEAGVELLTEEEKGRLGDLNPAYRYMI